MKYRSEIDGLRTVAVMSVILFHAGFSWFQGGFVGVDVFFVISGYLITTIIANDVIGGRFSIAEFYERRARRILPALFVVVLVCLPAAAVWMIPVEIERFSNSLLGVLLFAANIHFYQNSGYFAPETELEPFLHTWSLAVEEQFYIFFPLIVRWAYRGGWKWLFYCLAFIFACSFVLAQWQSIYSHSAGFYLLPARAWELLIGSFLGLAHIRSPQGFHRLKKWWSEIGSLIGLGMILLSAVVYTDQVPWPGVYALVPVIGTALIIHFAGAGTWIQKLLSQWIFVRIGLISYSAYLWHQPLFAFARLRLQEDLPVPIRISLITLCLLLAYLTWKWIETPFRKRNFLDRQQIFRWSFVAIVALLVVAGAGTKSVVSEGIASFIASPEERVMMEKVKKAVSSVGMGSMVDDHQCKFSADGPSAEWRTRFAECFKKYGPAIVVVGDSHGMDLFNAMALSLNRDFVVGLVQGACRPGSTKPECRNKETFEFIVQNKSSIQSVLFTQSGDYLYLKNKKNFEPEITNITNTYNYLADLSSSVPVIWLGPQPEMTEGLRGVKNADPNHMVKFIDRINEADSFIAQYVSEKAVPQLSYFSKIRLMDFKPSDFMVNGEINFSDRDHWSTSGEKLFGSRIVNHSELRQKLSR